MLLYREKREFGRRCFVGKFIGGVGFNSKRASYFTRKMGPFSYSRELQFGISTQWKNYRQVSRNNGEENSFVPEKKEVSYFDSSQLALKKSRNWGLVFGLGKFRCLETHLDANIVLVSRSCALNSNPNVA